MKVNDPRLMRSSSRHGTSVALSVWMRALVALSVFQMGCLVTERIEVPDQPDCPPSIEVLAGRQPPLNKIVKIDRDAERLSDGGVREFSFQPTIRDCNEDQSLEVLVLLDHDETLGSVAPLRFDDDVPPSNRDPYPFTVPAELLDPGCHQVELRVSGKFRSFSIDPEEPGDLGRAVWWLAVVDAGSASVDMTSCPNEQL